MITSEHKGIRLCGNGIIMEKQQFLITCGEVSAFHIPRWHELPEFDLYMDQVIALAEKYLSVLSADGKGLLTSSMINNYVKSGVLPPPKNKKYNRTHLAILMIVCITKPVMEISAISDVIQRGIEADTIENVLNTLAEEFENPLEASRLDASGNPYHRFCCTAYFHPVRQSCRLYFQCFPTEIIHF